MALYSISSLNNAFKLSLGISWVRSVSFEGLVGKNSQSVEKVEMHLEFSLEGEVFLSGLDCQVLCPAHQEGENRTDNLMVGIRSHKK